MGSLRSVHFRRAVISGGALRSRTSAVPKGRVRIVSGGMIGPRCTPRRAASGEP